MIYCDRNLRQVNAEDENLVGFVYQPLFNPKPGCYQVSGFITEGICGQKVGPGCCVLSALWQNVSHVLNMAYTHRKH
jgi:hypothetical protein